MSPRGPQRPIWIAVLRWAVALVAIIVILIGIAIPVLLHSARVHQYVLETARAKASASLGSQVEIRDFALHFAGISPTLDVYDVRVHGAGPHPDPPLLEFRHALAAVQVVSLLRKNWYLNDLQLDQPIVRVQVDKTGISNLPQTQKSGSNQTNIFDLGVRHATINGGALFYNNIKSAMDADLDQLQLLASFNVAERSYSGNISYKNGHLKMETFNPIPHDLTAKFNLTGKRFTIESATLRSGASKLDVNGTVDDYSTPTAAISAQYQAVVEGGEFRKILKNEALPVGAVNLAGTLQYNAQPNVPALRAVVLRGTFNSRVLEIRSSSLQAALHDISGSYTVAQNNAELRNLRANVLGGALYANGTIRDLTGASQSHLRASLEGVQLRDAQAVIHSPALKRVNLDGTANAKADLTWGRTFSDMVATTDSTLNGGFAPKNNPSSAARVPMTGVIHARYNGRTKEITLAQSYLRLPQTSLNLNGTVSNRSALQVQLQANDLHELETVSNLFQTTPSSKPLGLYGTASFNGLVRGSTAAPQITGHLNAANLRVQGSAWRSLTTDVSASPSRAALQNGELTAAKQGHISFNVATALHDWSYTPNSPIELKVNASSMDASDLLRIAGSQMQASGTLSANAELHGTQNNPIGQGVATLSHGKIAGEPIQNAQVQFKGTGTQVNATADLRLPAGNAKAVVTYMPKQQGYTAEVHADGIRLEQLQTLKARNLDIAGVVNLDATGRGTLQDPNMVADLRIPQLRLKDQTISGVTLHTNVANKTATFALDSDVLNNPIKGGGTVNLTGDYFADATLDTQRIQLQPLVALFAPSLAGDLSGQTELHATLRGPIKRKDQLEAHIVMPVLAANYKNVVQLSAAQPVRLDYARGVLNLQRTAIHGTDTDLQLQASVPVTGSAPMALLALGTVDLQLAQAFVPNLVSSGQLRLDVNSYGSRNDPSVQGKIEIIHANLATGDAPVGLENGNGVLTLTNNRVNITSFQGTVGGGTVTAGGGITYRPAINFDVALRGDGVRMLVPPGVRTGVGMNLGFSGTPQAAVLRGQLDVDQLSFTPDFDISALMGAFGGTISTPPGQGFINNVQLQLTVSSSNGINLVSRDLSLQGNANLRVQGTAAEPVVLGRVTLNGGDLLFRGNRYVLQAGTIDFVNPSRTEPLLNVSVNTTIQQYDIAMRFQGPVEKMRTSYTSDPSLPPSDIINLLAFGKTTEASAANPNPPGNLGAQSMIASAVSGQITNRVEKIAGISHLSVDPTLGGNGQTPGATVTIQQRVTGKLFVTFSTDVTGTERNVIQLEYKRSPRMSISGTRDQNGGFAVDARFQKSW